MENVEVGPQDDNIPELGLVDENIEANSTEESVDDSKENDNQKHGKCIAADGEDTENQTEIEEQEKTRIRKQLIEEIQKALKERKEMKKLNKTMQAKLSLYFKTKKVDLSPFDKLAIELEKDYISYLNNISQLRKELDTFESDFANEIEEQGQILKEKEQQVKELTKEFALLKRTTALRAVDSQTGKRMTPEEVDFYLRKEDQRDAILREVRLQYIKHNNALKEAEKQLNEMASLPNSVNVIEFDQLGVQIQTFFMKIGQREEEIAKFGNRCSNTINILGHYKEKLHFTQKEKRVVETKLRNLEELVKTTRDQLFILRRKQGSTRDESYELQQKFTMLQNESLFNDYWASKQKHTALKDELESLKNRYSKALTSKAFLQSNK